MLTIDDLHARLVDAREFYVSLGWDGRECAIMRNPFEPYIRLACDTGAIDYRIVRGFIHRETFGQFSKLIEFVDTDSADSITYNNTLCHNRRLLAHSA